MKAEHRRPLIAFLLVTFACFGLMAHAIRTDALSGLGRLDPSRILAAQMLVPRAPDGPLEAPVPAPPTESASIPSSTPSPSSGATRPVHAELVRHDAGGHAAATQVVDHQPQAPQSQSPSTPSTPSSDPTSGQPSHGPEHHGSDGWPGGGSENDPTHGTGLAEGLHDTLDQVTGHGHDGGHDGGYGHDGGHDGGYGHDHDYGDDHDYDDHGHGHDDHGYGHDGDHGHDDDDSRGWGHGWGH